MIFGVGASFTATGFGIRFPTEGKTFIHNTVDPMDINKNIPTEHALIGDSKLTLAALIEAVSERLGGKPRGRREEVVSQIKSQKEPWLQEWMPRLTSERDAAVALPRDLGPAAHGRRREHGDHPRRRQPARRALAVLGNDGAAELHRLGQDDAARLRPRPGDGRQAGHSRTSSASTCGAMRPSA